MVNADCEIDSSSASTPTGQRVQFGTCANCRFPSRLADEPSFSGDRIYVMKTGLSLPFFPEAGQVQLSRWCVGVFKMPEEPEVRYIKRTVGLPNEVIRIQGGDLWVKPLEGETSFERLRRPLMHQQAMQMLVYDDSHRAKSLAADPRWLRWTPELANSWHEAEPGRFESQPNATGWATLRYRNLVPDPQQWLAISEGQPLPREPRATLITDFYAYNTDLTDAASRDRRLDSRPWFQPHWVGDLTVSANVLVNRPSGKLRISIVRAGVAGTCEFDLSTGRATLYHGETPVGPSEPTALALVGEHEVRLANVDHRLTLWVDGELPFGEGRLYESGQTDDVPTAQDLEPVRIATHQADVRVEGLRLQRDIYYTLDPAEPDEPMWNEARDGGPDVFFDWLSDSSMFAALGNRASHDYPIRPGHYMMLGDNSPWSRDSRAWGTSDQMNSEFPGRGWDDSGRLSWEVPESLVIGKAFCVYWPSPTPIWPGLSLGQDLRVPVRPTLERLRWIR
jgi:signal peptidase I